MKHLIDAYAPAEMAQRVLRVGVAKARLPVADTLILAVLAGAFIGLGAAFATLTTTSTSMGFGPTRVLGGLTFSLGLILVVVAGAELFTGNNLVAMAWASREITTGQVARNWILVYIGNFFGSVGTALLVYWSGTWALAENGVALNALGIAAAKCDLGWGEAFVRGILCNALVCLAVWLCNSARSTTDKILAIVWPITGFVAMGFEHCIANMYFIPLGILLKADAPLLESLGLGDPALASVSLEGLTNNLIPVTLGNIVGGTLLVAGVYWFAYLRPKGAEGEGPA
ncbi:MAG: formate/nitrite transporter family protein [Gemmatimonadetes bacterium]|nr:formate/nitrite transporter family protein [Gemmatimonadota bacterium]NNM07027.1 formate/nitrite transporter family protein [Gemmatimonadota bacterium]